VLASHRPGLYPTVPLLFTPTLPLGVLAAVLRSWELGVATAGLVLVRTLLSWRLAVLTRSSPPSARDTNEGGVGSWLLGEGLLLVAFVRSTWQAGRVTWRGRTYALRPGGRMAPVWPELSGGPE
jgi:hypothetical protein